MSPFNRLVSMLLLSLIITTCEAINITPPEVHITVTNNLSNNMPITVHCSSPANDFGVYTIVKGGETQFNFQPIPLLSQDVLCSVEWGGQTSYSHLYLYDRDKDRGDICCSWFVTEKGPCLRLDQSRWDCYYWK